MSLCDFRRCFAKVAKLLRSADALPWRSLCRSNDVYNSSCWAGVSCISPNRSLNAEMRSLSKRYSCILTVRSAVSILISLKGPVDIALLWMLQERNIALIWQKQCIAWMRRTTAGLLSCMNSLQSPALSSVPRFSQMRGAISAKVNEAVSQRTAQHSAFAQSLHAETVVRC